MIPTGIRTNSSNIIINNNTQYENLWQFSNHFNGHNYATQMNQNFIQQFPLASENKNVKTTLSKIIKLFFFIIF